MKLKILIKKARTNTSDWSKNLTNEVMNSACDGVKEHLESELKDFECEIHKENTTGTITLIADSKKTFIAKKSNFCCKDFSDSIEITR